MTEKSIFDATPSALGYIYQVRYALLLALEKIGQVNDTDNCFISIETLDDISFEENGNPVDLLQAKYHSKPGNLTDRSSDIWKTIRVWSEMLNDKTLDFETATFTLLTTEIAQSDSVASYLGTDSSLRDTVKAMKIMEKISIEKENKTNKKAYDAFNLLKGWQKEKLLNSTYIISRAPTIIEVEQCIKKHLRMSSSTEYLDAFCSRLEGLWFKRSIEIMSSSHENSIGLSELLDILDDLRSQFLPGSLPSDYDNVEPEDINIDGDDRVFIEQLRVIGVNNRIIRNAIINFYRAFEQRSRWSRENLVKPGEIKKYMNSLKDEWENRASFLDMKFDQSSEIGKVQYAQALYEACQIDGAKPIRSDFKSAYVARGSYHDLSDKQMIGWHPDYKSLMNPANDEEVA